MDLALGTIPAWGQTRPTPMSGIGTSCRRLVHNCTGRQQGWVAGGLHQQWPLPGTRMSLNSEQGLGPVLQGALPNHRQAAALAEHGTHVPLTHRQLCCSGATGRQLLLRR